MNLEAQTQPPFDTDDRTQWRNFLGTRAGQRIFARVLSECPPLAGGGDTNTILVRNGEVRGFGLAIQALSALAEEERALPTEDPMYPSPEDDDAWKDGKSLNQPK